MKVALHCANPRLGNVAANIDAVVKAVRAKDADLVVFPELFLTGYNIGDDVQRLAFTDDDARLRPLLDACRRSKVHAITGAPRTPRKGITHNSALLVRPDGTTDWYDKRCLPNFTTFREGLFFTPGKASPVWHTEHGTLGIHICYDLFFPEHQRAQALLGADVLVNISASPSPSRRFFEALLQARAIENGSFVAYTNNVGAQDSLVFWGGAQAIGPRGQTLGHLEPYQAGKLLIDLDMDDLTAAREFRPTLRDGDPAGLEASGHLQAHTLRPFDAQPHASPRKGRTGPRQGNASNGSQPASGRSGSKGTTKRRAPGRSSRTKADRSKTGSKADPRKGRTRRA